MKRFLLTLALLLIPSSCFAQNNSTYTNPLGGNVTAADAGTCSTTNTYLWQHLPSNASTTTINLAGTFSGTVTVRMSNNGGSSWATQGTQTAAGTVSYPANGFTDVCADVTTYVSGNIGITISTGIGINNGSSGGSSFPVTTAVAVNSGGSITVNTGGSIGAAGTGTITATNGVGGGAGPVMAVYVSKNCPATDPDGVCVQTFADTVHINNLNNWSTASPTVTAASSTFVPTDTGKSFMGWSVCSGDSNASNTQNGSVSGSALVTLTYVSATSITLSSNPANASTSGAGLNCGIYGHPDDTAAVAADAILAASSTCPLLEYASSGYLWQSPHHRTQPPGCLQSSPIVNGAQANIALPAGFTWRGRMNNPTTIFLAPSYPSGDPCISKPGTGATAAGGCQPIPLSGAIQDLLFDGGGNYQGTSMSGKIFMVADIADIERVTVMDFGCYDTTIIGLQYAFQNMITRYNNACFGGTGMRDDGVGSATNVWDRVVVESSVAPLLVAANSSNADVSIYFGSFSVPGGTAGASIVNMAGAGKLRMFGGRIVASNGSSGSSGLSCYRDSGGGSAYFDSTVFNCAINVTTSNGVFCSHAGCVMSFVNGSSLTGTANASAYADTAGGTAYFDPTTTFSSPFSSVAITGTVNADGHMIAMACTGTATPASTLGLYGTGPNEVLTTCTSVVIGSGIVMNGSRTVQNFEVKLGTAGTNASSGVFTVLKNGGATTITCTTGTTAECHDFTHTVAAVQGDLISVQFTTQAADTLANAKVWLMWQ